MRIQRVYRCPACGERFKRIFIVEDRSEITDPPCPSCYIQPAPVPDRIASPSIRTNKSRAADAAWEIAQADYGLTDMNDARREGETAFKPPTPTPASGPGMIWGGASGGGGGQSNVTNMPSTQQMLSNARGIAAVAKSEGRNPMKMLHDAKPRLRAIPMNKGP